MSHSTGRQMALALLITTTLRPNSGSPVATTTRLTVPRTR